MKDIADRIRQVITEQGLTNTQFADNIDIDRGSIAHILSGRNNPSLKVITNIHKTYGQYSLDWLINGKTSPISSVGTPTQFDFSSKSIEKPAETSSKTTIAPKGITKVIIVYSDGSTQELQK